MNPTIQIRRNRDFKMSFTATEEQVKALQKIIETPEFPPIPPEVQSKVDEANRKYHELERQIWEHFEKEPTQDQLGDWITPETHEIGYDTEMKEIDGFHYMIATQMYVRPKKSEFEC